MGHSQADKALSRERVLKQAAAQIRDAGLESVSVARLMQSVNLTHGGFYGHFGSRSELLQQALARALDDGQAASRSAGPAGAPADFSGLVRSYLSRKHRDSRAGGCAMAALSSDVARADEDTRRVMAAHMDRYFDKVATALGDREGDGDKALFAVSAMVGALLVSRVLTDPARSDAVLAATRAQLLALAQDGKIPA